MCRIMLKFTCFLLLFIGSSGNAFARDIEIRIATAANFYPTLKKIKKSYEAITGNKLTIVRGSTGKLYAQIVRGAPYDIFFSADSARADRLVEQGKSLELEKGRHSLIYAEGRLVLWRADAVSSQELRQQLISENFAKLASANPRTAPYGKASVEALKAMELYEEIKHKLVYGENIAQTLQFVQSGAADLGLVARAYVKHDIYWEIDSYLHQPIKQKVILLKQSAEPEVAREFLQYIQSPAIKKLIIKDGYEL